MRMRPWIVWSFRPRFRTVSIMPGMENLEPERTDTSSGLFTSPNLKLPTSASSTFFMYSRISASRPSGTRFPSS